MRLVAAIAAATAALGCIAVPAASATPATVGSFGLTFIDGHGQTADDFRITFSKSRGSKRVVVRDAAGLRSVGGCQTRNEAVSVCPWGPLELNAARGDDRIQLAVRRAVNPFASGLAGGRGDDVIVDASESSLIFGGPGDDVLRGAGGFDEIQGDDGRDALVGGRGTDVLFAKDHTRDRRLECGPGRNETARTDPGLDPDPRSC